MSNDANMLLHEEKLSKLIRRLFTEEIETNNKTLQN